MGALKEYLHNGSIKIVELPFGENRSDKKKDNPKDRKNSVYSKKSNVRKKIEIVEILELK